MDGMAEVARECVQAVVAELPPAEALAALSALLAFAGNLRKDPHNAKYVPWREERKKEKKEEEGMNERRKRSKKPEE